MYIRKNEISERENFPINYNGSLIQNSSNLKSECKEANRNTRKYTVKRNKHFPLPKEMHQCQKYDNDELVLIGALAFLYIGCEHSKDNLILMAILAYLLFFGKNN